MIEVTMKLSFDDMESADLEDVASEVKEALRGHYIDVVDIRVTRNGKEEDDE